ncbi:RhoGAP-domain-containing protein [Meredithblackwellia eburnea MCA 4105]
MSHSSSSSPPTKASLLKWWKVFSSSKQQQQQQQHNNKYVIPPYVPPGGRGRPLPLDHDDDGTGRRVFGVGLDQSLKYASVAISMVAKDGEQYVYGYVPIIVAKCGMMLKETATSTEGIFRVSGSNKRINQLQLEFDSPPRYGKDLDWRNYTVHDAASVLRRYLNMMPEPVIPQHLYREFTGILQLHLPLPETLTAYKHLITLLPPTSRYLLLYLLDFLSVFARMSNENLMTASNLAVVFQPGLVSSRSRAGGAGAGTGELLGFPGFEGGRVPERLPSPTSHPGGSGGGGEAKEEVGEHGRGKEVLEFLIEQQGEFVWGLERPVAGKGVGFAESRVGRGQEEQEDEEQENAQDEMQGNARANSTAPTGEVGTMTTTTGAGAGADLARRGSEKSVERRRLRKSLGNEGGNGKVKRSRTLPSGRGRGSVPPEGEGGGGSGSSSPKPSRSYATPSPTPSPQTGSPQCNFVPLPPTTTTTTSSSSPKQPSSPRRSGEVRRSSIPLSPGLPPPQPVAEGDGHDPTGASSTSSQLPAPPSPSSVPSHPISSSSTTLASSPQPQSPPTASSPPPPPPRPTSPLGMPRWITGAREGRREASPARSVSPDSNSGGGGGGKSGGGGWRLGRGRSKSPS